MFNFLKKRNDDIEMTNLRPDDSPDLIAEKIKKAEEKREYDMNINEMRFRNVMDDFKCLNYKNLSDSDIKEVVTICSMVLAQATSEISKRENFFGENK